MFNGVAEPEDVRARAGRFDCAVAGVAREELDHHLDVEQRRPTSTTVPGETTTVAPATVAPPVPATDVHERRRRRRPRRRPCAGRLSHRIPPTDGPAPGPSDGPRAGRRVGDRQRAPMRWRLAWIVRRSPGPLRHGRSTTLYAPVAGRRAGPVRAGGAARPRRRSTVDGRGDRRHPAREPEVLQNGARRRAGAGLPATTWATRSHRSPPLIQWADLAIFVQMETADRVARPDAGRVRLRRRSAATYCSPCTRWPIGAAAHRPGSRCSTRRLQPQLRPRLRRCRHDPRRARRRGHRPQRHGPHAEESVPGLHRQWCPCRPPVVHVGPQHRGAA